MTISREQAIVDASAGGALEIRATLANGRTVRFVQDQADRIEPILRQLHPGKMFTGNQIVIAGNYSMTGIAPSHIARIDVMIEGADSPAGVEWYRHLGSLNAREISREEFLASYDPNSEVFRRDRTMVAGQKYQDFAEIEFTSNVTLLVAVDVRHDTPLDDRLGIAHLLKAPALILRPLGKPGVTFVNPAHIARWTLYPGPPTAPATAWMASRLPD